MKLKLCSPRLSLKENLLLCFCCPAQSTIPPPTQICRTRVQNGGGERWWTVESPQVLRQIAFLWRGLKRSLRTGRSFKSRCQVSVLEQGTREAWGGVDTAREKRKHGLECFSEGDGRVNGPVQLGGGRRMTRGHSFLTAGAKAPPLCSSIHLLYGFPALMVVVVSWSLSQLSESDGSRATLSIDYRLINRWQLSLTTWMSQSNKMCDEHIIYPLITLVNSEHATIETTVRIINVIVTHLI